MTAHPAGTQLIDSRERTDFERRGFSLVRGLFGADPMRSIAGWVEQLQALPETPGRQMMYFDATPAGRLLNRIENFAPFHAELGSLLQGPALLGRASALFGEPAVLFKDKINFKLSGGGGFEPHQDAQAGWDEYARLFITAAVAVDATTLENGCLELANWKHRRELIGPLWEPIGDEQLRALRFDPLPMQPGDAVFFDSYLPHRSAPNLSASPRRVLYITYSRAAEGDQRARYYADKRKSYPPDCEREPGKTYAYRV